MRLTPFSRAISAAADALLARDVGGGHLVGGGRPAGADDEAGALVADLRLAQAGIGDRLLRGDEVVGRAVAHEAPQLAVHRGIEVQRDGAVHVAAEAALLVFLDELDAAVARAQRADDLVLVVADAGDDPQPCDDDASHDDLVRGLLER